MKKKLSFVFFLIVLSLTGIVIFQAYWTVNAYQVNKKTFDSDIDVAMQKAMDDCKKEYFDSLRVVLIRRLSDTMVRIKVDTVHEADTINVMVKIHFSDRFTTFIDPPFTTTIPVLNTYKAKINHKPTLPELLIEASFYIPQLREQIKLLLGMEDIHAYPEQQEKFAAYNRTHITVPEDSMLKFHQGMDNSIYGFPPNTRKGDSIKLHKYFRAELDKMHIAAPFNLNMAIKATEPSKLNAHYSETNEYSYQYHGFKMFGLMGPEYFARAVFRNPQYTILRRMLITLILSVLLIVLTIYCFLYIVSTILQQKRLAELKDDFINNMTHELKTPIATITVAIEGMQKFNALNDPEKTQRYLQTSRNELDRLNELVTKVLNMAAFENREIALVKEKIDVDVLINDVISSEKLKTKKQVNITYTNEDGIKEIVADKLHFRNVLINLVDNAIKYSAEPVNIIITCYKNDDYTVFSVKDNGMGIPQAHLNQVFDKFHRVPSGNIHNVKGTGLGLSYVKYIIEAHGGNVSVKSEINAGSEFIVSIL